MLTLQNTNTDATLCPRCNKNPALEPHTCPFAEDVDGDSETLCSCCDECAGACADDI